MPEGDFKWMTEEEMLSYVNNYENWQEDDERGAILMVDLIYPPELHW